MMKLSLCAVLTMITAVAVVAQPSGRTLRGTVLDSKTKLPLSRATIRIKRQNFETTSDAKGEFTGQISNYETDSIEISYVGYRTFRRRVIDLPSHAVIPLEDYSLQLRTVTITSRKLNLKNVDNSLRRIKGNLYTYETETTNGMYNLFLNFLEEQDDHELLRLCDYDLTMYNEEDRKFYNNYGRPFRGVQAKKDTSERDFTDFPAVNVSHEGATLFCQWFAEQYNNHTGKKKFKKVKFRLPTMNEWQIAALGYPKFQSWNLDENNVEAIIPDDTLSEIKKGRKAVISVKEIQYPWWNHYHYRNKVTNIKNCYLGNFDSPRQKTPCEYGRPLPGNDGWTKMARTAAYFPNDIGLYDIVGNVAEMIDEKGKALGGSWNDKPEDSTIRSMKGYKRPNDTVGFRVFMEVVEE